MQIPNSKMVEFARLLKKHTPHEGVNSTSIPNLKTYRLSEPYQLTPQVYEPSIIMSAQGKKHVYLKGKRYDYNPGNLMTLFAPMPLQCELIEATPEKPLLVAALQFDRNRLNQMIYKMESIDAQMVEYDSPDTVSGIFSATLNEKVLDVMIRLIQTLEVPNEAAILGDSIVDEMYFRILSEEQGGMLKYHLQQRGQIHEISRVIEYVHQNLEKNVSVDDLANIANMSSSGFHKKFKEVMHLSPLQYTKSIKLNRAQHYIVEGKSVSEAGFMVGYNSSAQFSREYKRFFGMSPSATLSLPY